MLPYIAIISGFKINVTIYCKNFRLQNDMLEYTAIISDFKMNVTSILQ